MYILNLLSAVKKMTTRKERTYIQYAITQWNIRKKRIVIACN